MTDGPRHDEGTQALPIARGSVNRFRMMVMRGVDAGARFEAISEECAIGTSPANQLVLTDPLVSRHHCVVRASSDGAMLLDLGSTNGTRVGGVRIEAAFLENGMTVEVGETVIRLELLDERISQPISESGQAGGLFGISAAMRRIFAVIDKVASTDVPVLLEGEAGVGKSSLAELIHRSGGRGEEPLLVVDLTSMPVRSMESALFGTGEQGGALAAAAGGTVVLEEIGQLPAQLQITLLAALNGGHLDGTGSEVSLAARVIATTQSDLRDAVNSRRFRSDLFYRLSGVKIRVPPLRERREDIPPLIELFYSEVSDDDDSAPPAELLERLFWRPWPGNVRELRAAVERAALIDNPTLWHELGGDSQTGGSLEFDPALSYRESKEQVVAQFERWYATELIRRYGGNLSRAARAARMDRSYLRELLRRHDIPLPSEKAAR